MTRFQLRVRYAWGGILAHALSVLVYAGNAECALAAESEVLASVPASAPTIVLEAVEVKGTKEEKSYFQSTESVTILQSTELPGGGRENSLQVLNAVPNVQVQDEGESFSIRGINSTGVTGYQKDNLASVLIDGLFQTDLALDSGSFYLWDLDWIEVLKGAQSANQGINSLAGTILLEHRKPEWFGRPGAARLGVSNFWNREFAVTTNAAPIQERLAFRLSYAKEMNDGTIQNRTTGNNAWGGWNRDRVRLATAYRFTDRNQIELELKAHRNRQGGSYVQSDDPFRDEVYENVDTVAKTQNYQAIARNRREFGEGFKHEWTLGYSTTTQRAVSDADGTAQDTAGVRYDRHDDSFAQAETLLRYRNDRWNTMVGLHAHHYDLIDDYSFQLLYPVGGGATPIAIEQDVERSRTTYSLFDSTEFRITPKHSITGGARLEYVRNRYGTGVFGRRTEDLGSPAANTQLDTYLTQVSGNYAGDNAALNVLPKLAYLFEQGRNYFGLSYSRAYRTGGVAINRRRARAVDYDPEFTNNYEFSYKHRGARGQISANVFYIDWKKQQVQVQLSGDFYDTQVTNAAASRVWGGELETRIEAAAAHSVVLGAGYSNTRFQEFRSGAIDYRGNEFPFAAKVTGRLAHEARITDSLFSLAVVRYVSGAFTNAENTRRAEPQFYLDWNLRTFFGDWVVEGYANNLLNNRFLLFNGVSTNSTYPAHTHRVNTPRELGMRVSYFW